jgi:DNA-binding XRE family transcriptional regulator
MITAAQLRAARGLLDWTRNELAEAAKVSPETVKNIEHGVFRPQEQTAEAIMNAFRMHDVEFTDNEGVRKVSDSIVVLRGFEGFKTFMDDVYGNAKQSYSLNGTKPMCVCNVDNNLFKKYLKDYAPVHIERMSKIEGLKIKILATKKEEARTSNANYLSYKFMEERNPLPFYVYGDKFAILNFSTDNAPMIILINSTVVAQSYRDQFDVMWNSASTEPKK